MPTIRVMNWNIQNLGPTKAGIKHHNYDILAAIAKVVVDNAVDLFVLLELNTTIDGTAKAVMTNLLTALNAEATKQGNPGHFLTCVLSPNTGLEFYGFFIRDTAVLRPLPLTGPAAAVNAGYLLGEGYTALTDAEFTKVAIPAAPTLLPGRFPLLTPDEEKLSAYGRPLGVPLWPGTRWPSLGLFEVAGAAAANQYLPVVACHFAPDHTVAARQIGTLPYFSLLKGLAPNPAPPLPANAPVQLKVRDVLPFGPFTARPMNQAVVTGDFNIDFLAPNPVGGYAGLTNHTAPNLDYGGFIPDETHLVTASNYSPRTFKTTGSLAINAYDNFFVKGSAANGGAFPAPPAGAGGGNRRIAAAAVVDVPGLVKNRTLQLGPSVQYYEELDQRGFVGSQQYKQIIRDFATQLAGDKSHIINLEGALVGGRLISDHLPVMMDVQLA